MRTGLLLPILLPLCAAAQPGPYWAYGFGGPADDRFTAIARGPGDTIYACGTFSGLMHSFTDQITSAGVTDMFLVKMDTAGTVYWTRAAGGPGVDRATDIAVDGNGDIIVTGQFSGTFLAGGSSLTSSGPSQDIFITKWNAAGQVVWARAAGGSGNTDIAEQVALDGAGDVYVAGQFSGTATFGGLSITSTYDPFVNALGDDVFIAKYSSAGDALWVKKGAAIHQDQALGLAVDDVGNAWLAGRFSDVITFDQAHVNTLNNAAFVVRFDAAGNEQWFRRIGGGGSVIAGDLCQADGTLWLCGSQSGNNLIFGNTTTAIASAYPYSAFAVGFDAQGEVSMQRTIGSGHSITAKGIDVQGGEVFLGGDFSCQALELSELSGGDGLLLSWGAENGWACVLDLGDGLTMSYAQMLADHEVMDLRAVVFGPGNTLFAAGEFADELTIPTVQGMLRAYPGDSLRVIGPNGLQEACGDTTYYDAAAIRSRGVLDGFVMKGFIRTRRPLDIFARPECEFALHPVFQAVPSGTPTCVVPGFEASYCGGGAGSASFDYDFGPVPRFLWNTGETTAGIAITTPGTYTAGGEVGLGCFSGSDSVSIGLCEPVGLPGITDDQGVNDQDSVTQVVVVCDPQQVTLTAGPVPGTSFYWTDPVQDISTDTTVIATADGGWYLTTVNDDGCAATTGVQLSYLPNDTLGEATMEGSLAFPQDADGNDTITICANDEVIAELSMILWLDGVQQTSSGNFGLSDTIRVGGSVVDQGPFDLATQPKTVSAGFVGAGWYVFESLAHISDEPCNDHFANGVWRDSVYVNGSGGTFSQVDIVGPIFLCSGGSVTLTAVANLPGSFDWGAENGGIIGPDDANTLTLVEAGPVQVIFTPQDTGACTLGDMDTHSIALVDAPVITMDPPDGLVCQGDQVDLEVVGATGTYTWYGPGGPLVQTGPAISVADAGTYFCVANTVEGCNYATALQTVSPYGTPYLSILPQPVLCAGGSVQVSVEPLLGGDYAWSPPLTGNTPSQVISAPGTYTVSVMRCGVVTLLSFTITQSSPDVSIIDHGPFDICPQDSVLLTAAPGLVAYVWQPGNLTGQQVFAQVEGSYSVIGFDQYGCTDTASAVVVQVYDFVQPITAQADTACANEPNIASASGSGSFTWYADAGGLQPIGSGTPVALGPFPGSTTVYVTQTDAECASLPIAVQAVVVPAMVPTQILGDTTVCIGSTLSLIAAPGVDLVWSTPFGDYSGPEVYLPLVGTNASGTWSVVASQSGCANGFASVEVLVPQPQVHILDEGPFSICPGDSVLLQASSGMAQYLWIPEALVGQFVYTQDTGHYVVVGTDMYGCLDTAGTAVVDGFFFGEPLVAGAVEVCAGDTAIATANGSGTLTWYADAALTQPLGSGAQLLIPDVPGNATVYITQFEAPCTSAPLEVVVPTIPLPPAPQIFGDNSLCTGDALLLNVSPQFPPNWITPAGPVAGFLVSVDYATSAINGTYSVYYTNDGCPGPLSTTEVTVVPVPLVDLGPAQTICIGESTTIDGGDALTWLWSTGSEEQTIDVGAPGVYWVRILDASGCTDSDTITVYQDDCEVDIPNFITPNGDGTNDVITLASPSDEPITLDIFNRWGQLLFTRTAQVVQWDGHNGTTGEEVLGGVYYYVLSARLANGEPLVRTGYFHVVR